MSDLFTKEEKDSAHFIQIRDALLSEPLQAKSISTIDNPLMTLRPLEGGDTHVLPTLQGLVLRPFPVSILGLIIHQLHHLYHHHTVIF